MCFSLLLPLRPDRMRWGVIKKSQEPSATGRRPSAKGPESRTPVDSLRYSAAARSIAPRSSPESFPSSPSSSSFPSSSLSPCRHFPLVLLSLALPPSAPQTLLKPTRCRPTVPYLAREWCATFLLTLCVDSTDLSRLLCRPLRSDSLHPSVRSFCNLWTPLPRCSRRAGFLADETQLTRGLVFVCRRIPLRL